MKESLFSEYKDFVLNSDLEDLNKLISSGYKVKRREESGKFNGLESCLYLESKKFLSTEKEAVFILDKISQSEINKLLETDLDMIYLVSREKIPKEVEDRVKEINLDSMTPLGESKIFLLTDLERDTTFDLKRGSKTIFMQWLESEGRKVDIKESKTMQKIPNLSETILSSLASGYLNLFVLGWIFFEVFLLQSFLESFTSICMILLFPSFIAGGFGAKYLNYLRDSTSYKESALFALLVGTINSIFSLMFFPYVTKTIALQSYPLLFTANLVIQSSVALIGSIVGVKAVQGRFRESEENKKSVIKSTGN